MPKQTSQIWTYFEDNGYFKARCKYCSKLLSFKAGSLQNLSRHLKTVHAALMKLQPTERLDIERKLDEEDDPVVTPSTSRTSRISIDVHSRPATQNQSLINALLRKPLSDKTMKDLNLSLVNMLVTNYLPFTIVENHRFKSFLSKLNSDYQLPDRKTLFSTLVPQIYAIIKEKVKRNICSAESFCLTTDSWTSTANESYIAITVHYVNDFKLHSNLLECIPLADRHTAQSLSEEILRVAKNWNIKNKIVAVVTDNAANMKAAVKLCGYKHVPCFAHNLNLVVQSSISEISEIKIKVGKIVEFFKRSPQASEKLRLKQLQLNMPILHVKQDVATRWNSTFDMFKRMIEINESLISTIALENPHINNLVTEDVKIIMQCCNILEFFKSATEEMSSEKSVTISKVILIVNGLKKRCTSYLNSGLEPAAQKLCSRLLQKLTDRFSNIECQVIYSTATLLDPRFKQYGFSEQIYFERAKRSLQEELCLNYDSIIQTEGTETTTKRNASNAGNVEENCNSIWTDFDMDISKVIEKVKDYPSNALKELDKYLQEPILLRHEDPIMWWKQRPILYPNLYPIALKKLTIISTSVPSERIFSKTGHIITEARRRLSGKRVTELIFINANNDEM